MSSVSIFGYGSLMNAASTFSTLPSATNFRAGVLSDYTRTFNLVSISGIRSGSANFETNELAALAIRHKEGSTVKGCVFDIPQDELEAYFEREHRYKRLEVLVTDPSLGTDFKCWTVVEHSDTEYASSMPPDEFDARIRKYYDGQLWGRRDIFPMRDYLELAVSAAYFLGGEEWLRNILEDTVLADEETCLLQYIADYRDRFDTLLKTVPIEDLYTKMPISRL